MIRRLMRPIVIRRAGEQYTPLWFHDRVWTSLLGHYRRHTMPWWSWVGIITPQILILAFHVRQSPWITIAALAVMLTVFVCETASTCRKLLTPGVRDYKILADDERERLSGHEVFLYAEMSLQGTKP